MTLDAFVNAGENGVVAVLSSGCLATGELMGRPTENGLGHGDEKVVPQF